MEILPSACQHFGKCGGCHAQFLQLDEYLQSKQHKVATLAKRLGVDKNIVQPMIAVGKGERRRASFRIAVDKGRVSLGFNAYHSHEIINIQQCFVLRPEIVALIEPLRACLQTLKKPSLIEEFRITLLRDGLDVSFTTKSPLKTSDKQFLLDFFATHNIVRVCENGQRVAGGNALITFSDIVVELPPEAFLQASEKAQNAMQALVKQHLNGCESIVDLYSGCGTFTFPLAVRSAYEGSSEMIAALHNAALKNNLIVNAQTQDLFKSPLTASELAAFDGAVINPPHNGASPQCQQLAQSIIKKLVMVSCNPSTFERDAKTLLHGGYALTQLTPVDQFYWSTHLELVACFERT
jgi:23S rRNA (uracil1939-C5)-methyltransferase